MKSVKSLLNLISTFLLLEPVVHPISAGKNPGFSSFFAGGGRRRAQLGGSESPAGQRSATGTEGARPFDGEIMGDVFQ